jgi:hypothetical protein
MATTEHTTMQVRNQIIEAGQVTLDVMQPAKTDYSGLHALLSFHNVRYDPTNFKRRGDWVQFTSNGTIYRTMSSRRFG